MISSISDRLQRLGKFGLFTQDVFSAYWRNPFPFRQTWEEAYTIGVQSLPILLIISAFIGNNLAIQGYAAFQPLGGQKLVGMFVALAGVRELGPILVAAMVASKAGTQMASHIAVMRIREQIDALEVMGVSSLWLLVVPRIFGIILILPALNAMSVLTILVSSYCVSVFQLGLPSHEFIQLTTDTLRLVDLIATSIKSIFFGIIISLVSCYQGYTSAPGPTGVGAATNAAVVISACLCAILNFFVSMVIYG